MQLTALSLSNFRNFGALELTLPEGLVLLVGENAQGKSNLLEGIQLLAIARSYRAIKERDLVRWEAAYPGNYAIVGGVIQRQDAEVEIRLGLEVGANGELGDPSVRKRVRVNGVQKRVAEGVGILKAVLFSAEDLELVLGPPSGRRRYLDVLLAQADAPYRRALQSYQRVLGQRNALLRAIRDGRSREDELGIWDQRLSAEGAVLLRGRYRAVDRLKELLPESFAVLAGSRHAMGVRYVSTVDSGRDGEMAPGEAMATALAASRTRDLAVGQTMVGPHRDDLRLILDAVEMSRHASRGQARLGALALRFAEATLLTERPAETPVVLLDDVLSELDTARRKRVLTATRAYAQCLVTVTDPTIVPVDFWVGAHWFRVAAGEVTPDER